MQSANYSHWGADSTDVQPLLENSANCAVTGPATDYPFYHYYTGDSTLTQRKDSTKYVTGVAANNIRPWLRVSRGPGAMLCC